MDQIRCEWAGTDPLLIQYHDEEWGKPNFSDRYLFEMLTLEGAQAGLSWLTILRRRTNYRKVFDNFDPEIISKYDDRKMEALVNDPGIIRNRAKIYSVRTNAQAFLRIQQEFGSFSEYVWQFVDGKPISNVWHDAKNVPSQTTISTKLSKDLKHRGFTFVGPVICYSFMQAVGMVNDHTTNCFLANAGSDYST